MTHIGMTSCLEEVVEMEELLLMELMLNLKRLVSTIFIFKIPNVKIKIKLSKFKIRLFHMYLLKCRIFEVFWNHH